jgi:hypothetical protein
MRKRHKIKARSILEPFDVSQDVPPEPVRLFIVRHREATPKGVVTQYESKMGYERKRQRRKNQGT